MVQFPVYEKLSVKGYQLYPGLPDSSELGINLARGSWIVLGVNGLGKSTLLLLLKHILTGAVGARSAGFTGERSDLVQLDSSFFAHRVSDGARDATAAIVVRFGKTVLKVERQLRDLRLVRAQRSDATSDNAIVEEARYRETVADLMGLASFEDSIRVLDRITFFLENRQPLIWDVSAQFEIFRALLTPTISEQLRTLEGEIVSNDSTARNLNAILYKMTSRRDSELAKTKTTVETQARLAKATAELQTLEQQEIQKQRELERAVQARSDSRVELKRADRAADESIQAYEQTKFQVLRHAFSGIEPTEQYIFLKLISEKICSACGNNASEAASELEKRREQNLCLVCGSPKHSAEKILSTTTALQARARKQYIKLQRSQTSLYQANIRFEQASTNHNECEIALEQVRQAVDDGQKEARRLRARLPASDQAAMAREETRIEGLRREVQNFRRDRETAENKIEGLLNILKTATEKHREELERNFQRRVRPFFGDEVRLVYSARKDRIGQGGRLFEFPAFEVEMTGGATEGQFVRRSADQVSLSQREYLDIVFRMSLLETFGTSGCTLIIDGPEGSLDALFADRAGDLFDNFSKRRPASNVILACNVVEGGFIPNTLKSFGTVALRQARIVNLLKLAAPTATLVGSAAEYRRKLSSILRVGTN